MSRWDIRGNVTMQKNDNCSEIIFGGAYEYESSMCEPNYDCNCDDIPHCSCDDE